MKRQPAAASAHDALLQLRRDREELRRVLARTSAREQGFPRSRTFRWLQQHVTPRSVLSGAVTALMMRPALLGRVLGAVGARRALSVVRWLGHGR
ncbi:MAG: hypothetical protein JO341_03660 [Gammaproteobacteria bacterium]|nr:hypothetical protein [Gammaproteobacteria bacterium]MBV9620097.1 hypothetical protein [Gammaproteobacteria bacterium]